MNKIRNFFKEQELKRKFKSAGKGHKLCEDRLPKHRTSADEVKKPRAGPSQKSEAGRKAAEAAFSRIERNQNKSADRSLTAWRAQAKKEQQEAAEAAERVKRGPKEVVQDSCPALTVSGVYFNCPLVCPDVLPRSEMEHKIKEFLYEQLPEEKGLTSCLIIHTCNKDKEKVKAGIEVLSRYVTNIIDDPTEEKYHKIRVNNRVFRERVAPLEGTLDFLLALGFELKDIENDDGEVEQFYVFPEEKLADIENLMMLKDALLSAEPIQPSLDRNVRVLLPSAAAGKITLPDDFFNLSVEELVKEQEARMAAVELCSQLRTKEMRQRDEIRELRYYRYSLVRVKFPDNIILQGTFSVYEKLEALVEFIRDNLEDRNRSFTLLGPAAVKLTELDKSLRDLKLMPAAVLTLQWDVDDAASENEIAYLKSETMALLQDM